MFVTFSTLFGHKFLTEIKNFFSESDFLQLQKFKMIALIDAENHTQS